MSNCSFFALFKRAITILLFQKEQQKEQSLICSFKKSERAKISKKRAIAHFQNEQMANPGCRVGQSLISAPFKRAIEQSLFFCSFQKSDGSFTLSKRATKRAIAHSLFQKEQKSEKKQKMSDFPNCSFFAQKKEQLLIFKISKWPTLAAGVGNRSFAHRSFLLISKDQLSDCSFHCSLQKSK